MFITYYVYANYGVSKKFDRWTCDPKARSVVNRSNRAEIVIVCRQKAKTQSAR